MELQLRPSSDDGDDEKLMNISVQDLISELRIATRIKQFDRVENVLVAREARLKGEVEKMTEILSCGKLDRMKIEEELKKCEKQCEQGKRAEELYEKLLAEVKKNGPREEDAMIEELRAENRRLGDELELWKRKFVEMDVRILRLQYDMQLLMNGGNAEGEYGADFGVPLEVKEDKGNSGIHVHGQENGNNNAESNRSQRNEDTNPNEDALGAPGMINL